jgi:hypothetical protein
MYLICIFILILICCHRIKLQLLVNGSGRGRTASESFTIAQHRQHLQDKIDQFHNKGLAVMGTNLPEVSARYTSATKHADDLDQLDLDGEDDDGAWLAADDVEIREEGPEIIPENSPLYLPSTFTASQREDLGWQELGNMELQLREGQANDLLERLRECLAEKSLKFRTEVRPANSQKKVTRAWGSVHRMDSQIKETVVMYRTARDAIGELGGAADLKRFQEIKRSDLKMSGDIVEENRVGQRSSVLPWFWRLDRQAKEYHGNYEKECKYSYSNSQTITYIKIVYRVNWLRARARAKRWDEEKVLLQRRWIGWLGPLDT